MTAQVLALLLAAAPAAGDVVARVDATAITRVDVQERVRALASLGRAAPAPEVVAGLVEEALLAAEARRQGLDRDPDVVETIAAQRRRLLSDALTAHLAEKAQPGDELLLRLYHQSGDTVRLVLVKLATREEAAAALARVAAGGDLSAEAARSADPALAKRAGDTGTLSRGQLDPALADAAFKAAPGAMIGPIELKLGWAIARVVERDVSDEAGFPARRAALEAFARRQLATQARQHLAEQLKARNAVKVDEAFLRSLGNRTDATPAELEHVIATVNGKPVRYRTVHTTISSLGGHLAGPATKVSFAQKAVEERLVEEAALERGLASSPTVTAVLPGIERNVLASALVARVAGNPADGSADPKVRAKLGELRSRAKIQVDEKLVASLSSPHP